MRLPLAVLFLVVAGHSGSNCAHLGSGAHAGGGHPNGDQPGSQASFSTARISDRLSGSAPSVRIAGTIGMPLGHAPRQPAFFNDLALGIRHVLTAGADVIEAALGLEPAEDGPPPDAVAPEPAEPACQSVEDCGDGQLGQGAVCDHWSTAPRSLGTCREACRDDADCPAPLRCRHAIDPDGPQWGGCIE